MTFPSKHIDSDGFMAGPGRDNAFRVYEEPPVPCDFRVGDIVTYTNDYGVSFEGRKVIAFNDGPVLDNQFIYLGEDEAYWYPVSPDSLTLESRE